LALSGLPLWDWGQTPKKTAEGPGEQGILDQVQQKARKAGLGALAHRASEHFVGVGDAPARDQADALGICEKLARVFLLYFQQHGFKVAFPKHRMTVVTLKDHASFRAYIGEDAPESVGGHYDVQSNQLVVFDFGSRQADLAAQAGRVNTFTLVHETTHLLSFNTGLLARPADVPSCISEGLATYFELWLPQDRAFRGPTNGPRLRALKEAGGDWIPIADLLADDGRFEDPKTAQLAYAESWLLVHLLLKTLAWRPKLQAYLAGLPGVGGAKKRVEHAEARLGPLPTLNKEVKDHAKALLRG
jgi:hypothetical protein